MLGFWIIAATAAVITIAILGRALLVGRGEADNTAAYDLQIYRDQLSELDRDLARGVIGAAEAERARVEISRRLLEADRKAQAGPTTGTAPASATWTALALSAALVVGGGLWLYASLGAPGTPDLPLKARIANAEELRQTRPSQTAIEAQLPDWAGPPAEAPAEYLELVDKLRAAIADRPDDLQGQQLLAQHEAALGNFRAAHLAQGRALALLGDQAGADDYTKYADLLVLAAQGQVSPEAETALGAALELNPRDPIALYYLGLLYGQTDRPDVAFRIWRDLLETSAPDEPWVEPIRSQIDRLAAMAGVDYTAPAAAPALAGPSAEDMAAAADMSPEDRAQMVAGMVDRLMERLATQGGTPEEWAQLIGALGVQGDSDRARAIWGEAQAVFAAYPDALAMIDAAAEQAGLSDPIGFTPPAATAGPDSSPDSGPNDSSDAAPVAGPDADDIAAAAEMSDEDRAAMIDGMVERLADELTTEGGPPQRWIMLLNSLGQLGDRERAREIWTAAKAHFADDAEGLAQVQAVADALGLAE